MRAGRRRPRGRVAAIRALRRVGDHVDRACSACRSTRCPTARALHEDRPRARAAADVARRARHARHDRLLRPARRSASRSRARPSSSRAPPARSAAWSARSRRCKGCRAVGIAGGPEKCRWIIERARLRRGDRLQERGRRERAARGLPRRHRRVLRQRRRRRSSTPRWRRLALARARRDLRRHLAVQQHRARCAGRRTTCRCSSTARRMTGFVVFDYASRYAEAAQQMARLDRRRAAQVARGRRAGPRTLPGGLPQAVRGRQRRQARARRARVTGRGRSLAR